MYKYFTTQEMLCKCGECKPRYPSHRLMHMLDDAREIAQIPFVITSGVRCAKHNKLTAGASLDSAHIEGEAADIACKESLSRFTIISALLAAGFRRIGVQKSFIHVDVSAHKPTPRIWTY